MVFTIFLAIQLYAMSSRKSIEQYQYDIVKTFDGFEIRNYEASLFTSVKLPTNKYNEVAGKGFSILGGYIFGGNSSNQKIAMTSPVAMTLEDSMTMMFMVPKNIKKQDLPKPNQSAIAFEDVPEKTVAAVRFGGWANDKRIEKYKNKLISALDAEEIRHNGKFYLLGYNPPYDLINRRNEIIVELAERSE